MTAHDNLRNIQLNLSGDYYIPPDKKTGSVSGDLTLPTLDAFLQVLNQACHDKDDNRELIAGTLEGFLAELSANLTRSTKRVELDIVSTLDPGTNSLSYKFKFGLFNK